MIRITLPLCCVLLVLTACENDPAQPARPGMQEREALDDAASMLDQQRLGKKSPSEKGDQTITEQTIKQGE